MHPAQKHPHQTSSTTLRTAQRYSPVAPGATLRCWRCRHAPEALPPPPERHRDPSPSAEREGDPFASTRTATVTESTPTAGTVHTPPRRLP